MDVGLTDQGRADVHQLATNLTRFKPSHLYTSPLKRAQQTAAIISEVNCLDTQTESLLIEQDYGDWDGHPIKQVSQTPDFQNWLHGDSLVAPPNGETLNQVAHRASEFLERLRLRHSPDDCVILVAHGGILGVMLCQLLNTPLANRWPYRLQTATYARVELSPERAALTHLSCR